MRVIMTAFLKQTRFMNRKRPQTRRCAEGLKKKNYVLSDMTCGSRFVAKYIYRDGQSEIFEVGHNVLSRSTAMALLDIEREAFSTFGHIPGVGKSISVDLWDLGLRSVQDLEGRDPEDMFEETRRLAGGSMDRCILYVYRCAVAYARDPDLEPELRKWWNWKD